MFDTSSAASSNSGCLWHDVDNEFLIVPTYSVTVDALAPPSTLDSGCHVLLLVVAFM